MPQSIPVGEWSFRSTPVELDVMGKPVHPERTCADNFECQYGAAIKIEEQSLARDGLGDVWFGDPDRPEQARFCEITAVEIKPGRMTAQRKCRADPELGRMFDYTSLLDAYFDANGYEGVIKNYYQKTGGEVPEIWWVEGRRR